MPNRQQSKAATKNIALNVLLGGINNTLQSLIAHIVLQADTAPKGAAHT
jgi:hypothetical protein